MNKSSQVVSETPVYQTEHTKGEKTNHLHSKTLWSLNCLLSCYQQAKWTWQQASNGIVVLSFMPFSIICQDKISILHWASGSSLFLVSCPAMWWRNVNDYNIQGKGFRKGGKREHLCAGGASGLLSLLQRGKGLREPLSTTMVQCCYEVAPPLWVCWLPGGRWAICRADVVGDLLIVCTLLRALKSTWEGLVMEITGGDVG
jgi:hypothetical protein